MPSFTALSERFFRAAAAASDRTAVATHDRDVTFGELAESALRLAGGLSAAGIAPGETIALNLPRDERLVAAMIGTWAAGVAYVPLDPRHASDRTEQVLRIAGARLVIDADTYADLVAAPAWSEPRPVADDDLAYLIFTSGSTGEPKGVQIEHGSVSSLLDWADAYFVADEVAWGAAVTSVAFDVSVMDLLMPLARGGGVVLADDVFALPSHRAFARVTSLQLVPSAATVLLEEPLPASVRTVGFAGERLPRALCDRAWANPNVQRVLNLYGPTESTVLATGYEVPRVSEADPPIGRPLTGTGALVRGEDGREVLDGSPGELWLTGRQLARGYVGRPDLTDKAFVDASGVRAYRTGDLVRRIDGEIHYQGRIDDQVKVRGFRIELGEVESTLRRLPEIRRAAAVADGDRLVGYVEGAGLDVADLRTRLRAMVPDHFVPDQFVVLDEFPLTTSGKTDRARLPRLTTVDGAALADDFERQVARIASDVLGVEIGGRDVELDTLGLHSLAAARLVRRLAGDLGRSLLPAELLGSVTVADVAELLRSAPPMEAAPERSRVVSVGDRLPLSVLQQDVAVMRDVAADPAVTSLAFRLRIDPAPDPDRLRDALVELTRLHPSLRMAVEQTVDGPVGRILEPGVTFERGAGLDDLAPVPLDGSGPTLGARWVERDGWGELGLIADHVALDGWGIGVLAEDLDRLLAGRSVEAPPVLDPPAYPHRPASPRPSEDPLGLGTAGRTSPSRGHRERVPYDSGELTPAQHLARLAIVLHRITGDAQAVIGMAAARRHRPGTERIVAPWLTLLPVAVQVGEHDTFADVEATAAAALAEALRHVDTETPDAADRSAVSVILSIQPDFATQFGRVGVLGEVDAGSSQADLSVLVNTTVEGPELIVEADGAVPREVGRGFAQRYLLACAAASDTRVASFDVRTPDEITRHEELSVGSPLAEEAPAVDLVDRILAVDSARTAVTDDHATRTYADVVATARSVGAALTAAGVRPGDRVCVCVSRDADLPGRLLGVLLAGAAYVPIDPTHPRARTEYVLGDAGCATVLVDEACRAAVDGGPDLRLLDVAELPAAPAEWTPPPTDPDRPAYVLHTSGSTGRPKGVTVLRSNLAWFCAAMATTPGFTAEDEVVATTTLTFDIAGLEIWAPLALGARVRMIDRDVAADGMLLAKAIDGATVVQATPSGWKMLLDAGWPGDAGVTAIAGGEVLPPDVADLLRDRCGVLWNAYGPTEATIWATMHEVVEPSRGPVPIGRPLPGVRVRVATRQGYPVPSGHAGELWIGGPGVVAGYHQRPDLAADRFVEVDGRRWYRTGDVVRRAEDALEYLNRSDDQIKVRGHRIEPGEVEVTLREHAAVTDVAVGARNDVLVAWWVAAGGAEVSEEDLAAFAGEALPAYFVPTQWVRVDALPLGPNGKLDRLALPDPTPAATPEGDGPQGPVEELVAQIWTRVLGVDGISRDSSFFALGGHSLAVTRVVAAIRDELDLTLPSASLFERPTLRGFAEQVTSALIAAQTTGVSA